MMERPIIYCDIVGHRRFLEVCTYFCDKRKNDGPLSEIYSVCSVSINKHKCPVVQQLYPKQRGQYANVAQPIRDVSDCGISPRESNVGNTTPSKPSRLSGGNGRKGTPLPKKQRRGTGDVLPPLRKQRVPKNGRSGKSK